MYMRRTADRLFGNDYLWSVLAGGRHQIKFSTPAAMMGGNVRVGLEDWLYIGPGKLANSNAEQVAKIRRIIGGARLPDRHARRGPADPGAKGRGPGEVLSER